MSEFKSDSSLKRILTNGLYTALRFGTYTLVGILFIPFLVKEYGSGSYGLIALAGFLTQYVGMISGCIGSAVARYLNVALNKNDWQQANEIFSTAIMANVGLILLQLPLYALAVWKLDWLIDFPSEVATDFKILVICNILIFISSTITGIFFAPLAAANRLDLLSKLDVIRQILRVVLLVALIMIVGSKLWIIGVVDLGLTLLFSFVNFVLFRRLTQQLVFRLSSVTKKWVRPVLEMAGWSLVSMLGFSLFVKTDIWMINRFVNEEMAGVYAALLVWPNLIKQIGGMFGSLFAPVFTIDFAKGNLERLRKACLLSSQVLSYGTAYIAGLFVVAAPALIRLWLDESYVPYTLWVQLMVGQLAFTISGSVVWHIFVTIGKTKYMGIGNLIPGILNILLSLFLIKLGYEALGVLIGTIVAVSLKENFLFPFWISKETGISYLQFLLIYLRCGLVFGVVVGISHLSGLSGLDWSILNLIVAGILSLAATLLLIFLMTNRENRNEAFLLVKTSLFKRGATP
jgi:membrane protein EpsK